jgi:hypothetical protein
MSGGASNIAATDFICNQAYDSRNLVCVELPDAPVMKLQEITIIIIIIIIIIITIIHL